jgi:hypothetical protein
MKAITSTIWLIMVTLSVAMGGGLAYNGADFLFYQKQLKLANVTPTEVLDKLNGCRVVYNTCELTVVGSDARHVPGVFNGVRIK